MTLTKSMQQTAKFALDDEAPEASVEPFIWWKSVAIVLIVWGVFILLTAFASLHDVEISGRKTSIAQQLSKTVMVFLPRVMLSVGLALYFQRHSQNVLTPKRLGWIAVLLVVFFIPPNLVYKTIYLYQLTKHYFPQPAEIVSRMSLLAFWLETILTFFALSAQIAYSYWYKTRQQLLASSQARQHVLDLKLIQLQGQLEPYFLLNSLNEIENLVIDAEGVMATRALARLSDLLRYIIESGQDEWPSVADEISFVRDYLNLQNLRFSNRLDVQWEVEEHVWSDYLSPPLLLYPLAEYAIKDLGEQLLDGAVCIRISCSILENHIHVTLKYAGNTNRPSSSTFELSAAKQRMFLLYGHTAFIQNISLDATRVSDVALTHGVMLAFPLRLKSDD